MDPAIVAVKMGLRGKASVKIEIQNVGDCWIKAPTLVPLAYT